MSYTNGIGNPQELFGATEAAASSSANRTAKAERGSASLSVEAGLGNGVPVDDAKLSSTATLMVQALTASDVRADKVAQLQQSIAAGTYNIPSSDVAAKVVSALLN